MQGVTEICSECQFDPTSIVDSELADRFATFAKRYPIPLTRLLPSDTEELLRRRPNDTTWSASEYVGHVTAVFNTTTEWVRRTVAEELPVLATTDVNAEVLTSGYNKAAVADLAANVTAAAIQLSDELRTLGEGSLDRKASFENRELPLRLLVTAIVHEGHHHLLDVGRVLRTLRQASGE